MTAGPVLLDSDTLSLLSRGHALVTAAARSYLERHGRFTVSSVTVFERLRGYRLAIRQGKPFEDQERQFQMLIGSCRVLPVDAVVADRAASIWAELPARRRGALGDILIAATALVHELPLVTRNRRDFDPISRLDTGLLVRDWSRIRA